MARDLPQGLARALDPRERYAESHSTLRIITKSRVLYLATVPLVIDGIRYLPHLRKGGNLPRSLNQSAERVDLEIQNVDSLFGLRFIRARAELDGARAIPGRYWRDLANGAEYYRNRMAGVIIDAKGNNSSCRLTVVSELFASRQIGGRRVVRPCQWSFKGPQCGYVGPLLDCNKLLDHPGGCAGRGRKFRMGGFVYIQ